MKSFALAGVVIGAVIGNAVAADLPSRVAPPVFVPPPPIFTWTGFYLGVNAGYAFDYGGRTNFSGNPQGLPTRAGQSQPIGIPNRLGRSADGFTGGGQIGYNYQLGNFGALGSFGGPGSGIVVGLEADAAYTDLESRRSTVGGTGAVTTVRSGLDYLGTVRGRVGYAFNQFLVYGTGGFAYGGVNNRLSSLGARAGFTPNLQGSSDGMETGYAYGGGIEYALPTNSFLNFFKASAVTLKAEYLHYDLGRSTVVASSTTTGVPYTAARFRNDGDLARAGLNYKFGSY